MELSIVIVSYNVKELLCECVMSLYAHLEKSSFEIIVVDNSSDDGTVEALESEFPEVQLIANNFNAGFSAANNQGMKISKGEYILLLNPDTCLHDNSLQSLLSYVKSHENVLAAPKLLNEDGSLQVSAWKDKTLSVMFFELVRIFTDRYPLADYSNPKEVDNVAGAAMLLKKTLLDKVGYFDNDLFWMEDFDLCYRIRKAGGKIVYFPAAFVVHYGGESKNKNLKIAYSNASVSKLKFYSKHFSLVKVCCACIIVWLHITSRLMLFFLISPFHSKFRKMFSAYAFTLRKYFRYIFLNDRSLV